jgi:hypothetical protein
MMNDGTLEVIGDGDPVAHGRPIDTSELVAQPAGEFSEPGLAAEQGIDPTAIGGDPGRHESRTDMFQGIELGREKRSKSEFCKFKFERKQRLAPV